MAASDSGDAMSEYELGSTGHEDVDKTLEKGETGRSK